MSFSVLNKIEMIKRRILNGTAEIKEYHTHWGEQFSFKELNEVFSPKETFGRKSMEYITLDELRSLPKEKLFEHGFGNWDDKIILIPLWISYFINPDSEVISIGGDKAKLSECDKDTRFGCIAFGFTL